MENKDLIPIDEIIKSHNDKIILFERRFNELQEDIKIIEKYGKVKNKMFFWPPQEEAENFKNGIHFYKSAIHYLKELKKLKGGENE